jgi:hypothetical protein
MCQPSEPPFFMCSDERVLTVGCRMGTKTNHKQNNRGRRADGRSFDQSRDEIIDGPPKRSCFPITFLPDQRAGEK